MSHSIQSVRREVMRRVYVAFFLRTIVKPFCIKAAFLAASVAGLAALVSVRNVFWNMPSPAEVAAFAKFILSAFVNTELAVQALSLSLLALTLWALRDLVRISTIFRFQRAVA